MIFRINRHQWIRLPIFVFAILVIACANEKLFDYNETDSERDSTFSGENKEIVLSNEGNVRIEAQTVKFSVKSSKDGNLNYIGNCSGRDKQIVKGLNEVLVTYPGDGQYNDCRISLNDVNGKLISTLALGTIYIDNKSPELYEIKPVYGTVYTNRPSYSFKTSETGTLSFSGKCRGNVEKAIVGINHIALITTEPGYYNDCTMILTDSSNNRSQPLKISPFVVVRGQS